MAGGRQLGLARAKDKSNGVSERRGNRDRRVVKQLNTEGPLDLATRRDRGYFTESQRLVCKLHRLVNCPSAYFQGDPVQKICLSRDDNSGRSGWNSGHGTGEYGVNLEGNATGCGGRGHGNNLITGDHSWEGTNGRRRRCGPCLSKGVRGFNGIDPENRYQKDGPPDYWYRDTPNFHSVL